MKWQLIEPHYIDEMVLPGGTMIGDDTPHTFRSTYNDRRINRKIGDPLPPSRAMTPMDEEARKVFIDTFGGEIPEIDPTRSIPITGAEGAPRVSGPGARPPPFKAEVVNPPPDDSAPKTGIGAASRPPLSPNTPQPDLKPELKKPAGHDSAKNPGDSKDTETAKAPDIRKI